MPFNPLQLTVALNQLCQIVEPDFREWLQNDSGEEFPEKTQETFFIDKVTKEYIQQRRLTLSNCLLGYQSIEQILLPLAIYVAEKMVREHDDLRRQGGL